MAAANRADAAGEEAAAQQCVLQKNSEFGQIDGNEEKGEQLLVLNMAQWTAVQDAQSLLDEHYWDAELCSVQGDGGGGDGGQGGAGETAPTGGRGQSYH